MENIIFSSREGATCLRLANSFVGPLAEKGVIKPSEQDDTVQELILDVIKQAEEIYNPEIASFSTFAYFRMKNHLRQIIRDINHERNILRKTVSLNVISISEDDEEDEMIDEVAEDGNFITPANEYALERKKMLILDVRNFIETLDLESKSICLELMGCSQRDVCARLGISHRHLRTKMDHLKQQMISAGLFDYVDGKF